MQNFVLVHGGMHGAWCWKRVLRLIREAGHEVITPNLTGLGARAHLGGQSVDLLLHVKDVLACVETEELSQVNLVGHSYAGMVITGVADRIPERIQNLIYLDALVPLDGECASDIVSRGIDYSAIPGGMLPVPPYDFGLTDPQDIAWVKRRVTSQSVLTVTQPIQIKNDLSKLRRSFVECVLHREEAPLMSGIAARAALIAKDKTWSHYHLQAGHDCMISHPKETSAILLRIAGGG
jgi:pimeloyl-ACP methyl ester carboxylesterase